MLFQQLKRDLIHGRLYCSAGESAALGALIVQGKVSQIINLSFHKLRTGLYNCYPQFGFQLYPIPISP